MARRVKGEEGDNGKTEVFPLIAGCGGMTAAQAKGGK